MNEPVDGVLRALAMRWFAAARAERAQRATLPFPEACYSTGYEHALSRCGDELAEAIRQVPVPAPPIRCDHKFVDSTNCLKCGWRP